MGTSAKKSLEFSEGNLEPNALRMHTIRFCLFSLLSMEEHQDWSPGRVLAEHGSQTAVQGDGTP